MNTNLGINATLCAALGWLAGAPAAFGLANGSFEDSLTDWDTSGHVEVKSTAPYVATDGTHVAVFNSANTTGAAGLFHALDTEPGHTYVIEFDVGNLGYNPQPLTLWAGVGGAVGTHTYTLASETVVIPGITGGRTRWVSKSLTFTPQPGQEPLVAFWDQSAVSDGLDLVLDHVRIREIPTPPPSGPVANGSFESGLDGWEASGNVNVRNAPPYLAADGLALAVFNSGNTTPNGQLSQQIPLSANQWYRLEFDVGCLSYNSNHQRLHVNLWTIWGYKQAGQIDQTIDIPGPGGGATAWVAASFDFISTGNFGRLTFTDESQATQALDLVLDHVRIVPIPAPALLENGGFENGLAGWSASSAPGAPAVKSEAPYVPTEGAKLVAFGSMNLPGGGSLSQSLAVTPGRPYELLFDAGNLSYVAKPQALRVLVDDGPVRLIDSTVWIPATSTTGGTNWLRDRKLVIHPSIGTLTITFLDASTVTDGVDLVLDNVRLTPQ